MIVAGVSEGAAGAVWPVMPRTLQASIANSKVGQAGDFIGIDDGAQQTLASTRLDAALDGTHYRIVSTAERIFEKTKTLPPSLQKEVLDFVKFLEQRGSPPQDGWHALSLASALRGMENEEWCAFSDDDLVQKWQ